MLQPRQNMLESTPWGSLCWVADPGLFPIDSNGNLTQKVEGPDTWAYEWNAENQLTRVTKNSIEQARFGYDPIGRRVEKIAGGVTASYTYDSEDLLREVRGGATFKVIHGPGIDEPLAREDGSGSLSYLHSDALGSIVKRTSQTGVVTHAYRYDVWGNIETGAAESGSLFTGHEWDPEVELMYYRARYYDTKVGRFISEDPIRWSSGGTNWYAYVDGDPVNYTDAFGLAKIKVCLGGSYNVATAVGDLILCFQCELTAQGNFVCKQTGTGSAGAGWNTSLCVTIGAGASEPPPDTRPVTHSFGFGPFAASGDEAVRGNNPMAFMGGSVGLQWPPTPSYSVTTPVVEKEKTVFNMASEFWRHINRTYCGCNPK